MIAEVGVFSLYIAVQLVFFQVVFSCIEKGGKWLNFQSVGVWAAWGQFTFISLALFSLAYVFLNNDFSVLYVARHSNTYLPFIYRFCAIWGGHEGSLLLWIWLLSLWTCGFVMNESNRMDPIIYRSVIAIIGGITASFLIFLLATSNPFTRQLTMIPKQGLDLNPLLQDPGLVSHPPLLYMGYVGFTFVFALVMAGLWHQKINRQWAALVRPWALAAWCFLTLGIVLGSAWAYRELGWGGFWFWDPVENAALLPWLSGTALIHSLILVEKQERFKLWTVFLAIVLFCMSLFGTFLVRSGILVSVHAFASDPKRGMALLFLIGSLLIVSIFVYIFKSKSLAKEEKICFFSTEWYLLINNLLLMTAMVVVLIGTLYPLVLQVLGLGKISVGAPYFNQLFLPLGLLLLVAMGLVLLSKWRESHDFASWLYLMKVAACSMILAAVVLMFFPLKNHLGLAYVGLSFSFWLAINLLLNALYVKGSKRSISLFFAHIGVVIFSLGITISSTMSIKQEFSLSPGDKASLLDYSLVFNTIKGQKGPHYHRKIAHMTLYHHGKKIGLLYPELRFYIPSSMALSKVAIDANIWRDIYIALGEKNIQGEYGVRFYIRPFVRWIWAGGFCMVLGGLLGIFRCLNSFMKKRKHSELALDLG